MPQEAELLGEEDLAHHVEGGEGEELVEVHGFLLVGVLVHPAQQHLDGAADGVFGLDHVGHRVPWC